MLGAADETLEIMDQGQGLLTGSNGNYVNYYHTLGISLWSLWY